MPRRRIVEDLAGLGLQVATEDVFTPAVLARALLIRENLTPSPVIHPDLREDFEGLAKAVLLGDAGGFFSYEGLNQAFRKIVHGAEFLALPNNRNFLDHDGELSRDLGAFVAGLEYASGRKARILGKPSPLFFASVIESLGCSAKNIAMIGDDVEGDVSGAMAAGLMAVLVQTTKYRSGQESDLVRLPTFTAKDLEAAVGFLFSQRRDSRRRVLYGLSRRRRRRENLHWRRQPCPFPDPKGRCGRQEFDFSTSSHCC